MNKLTIALEYTDKDHPLIKSIMDNMMNTVSEDTEDSVKVYVMAREDLFDKIERLEEERDSLQKRVDELETEIEDLQEGIAAERAGDDW